MVEQITTRAYSTTQALSIEVGSTFEYTLSFQCSLSILPTCTWNNGLLWIDLKKMLQFGLVLKFATRDHMLVGSRKLLVLVIF